jgi:hypothetical protein
VELHPAIPDAPQRLRSSSATQHNPTARPRRGAERAFLGLVVPFAVASAMVVGAWAGGPAAASGGSAPTGTARDVVGRQDRAQVTSTSRVTFGIAPSSASGPDGRSSFSLGVTPGGVLRDNVALVNYSKVPLALGLSATDAEETAAGGFGLLPPGSKPIGVGAWVTLPVGSASLTVPPAASGGPGSIVVPFVAHVPAKAAPGDYVGGLVASLRTVGANRTGQKIVLYQRVGTRIYVQVSGELVPALSVSGVHATYEQAGNPFGRGRAVVTYQLRNAGNVDLAVTQSVSVSQLVARTVTEKAPPIALLLPGAAVRERVVLGDVWPQILLQATVTATGHDPLLGGPAPVKATGGTAFWAVPWPLIAVLVLIAAFGALWRRRRRRRRAAHSADDALGAVGFADDVATLPTGEPVPSAQIEGLSPSREPAPIGPQVHES